MTKFGGFLQRKNIRPSAKLYFIDTMSSMALGLFASLLIGTIFRTLGQYTGVALFTEIAGFASKATGAALGVAIAYALKAPPLVLLSAAVVGMIGNDLGTEIAREGAETLTVAAGPAGAFIVTVVAVELGKMVSKETHIDILVTPVVTILSGALLAKLICPAVAYGMYYIGYFVNWATEMQPFLMGILVSVVVGIILTLPISSAAICAMIGITGLAGGAATAGCCAQMVGFAVISFRENRWSGLVAQGLGTSMLQMGNIVKNPKTWIPPILTSAITGPIATCLFHFQMNDPSGGVASGMGTCGMVGPIGVYAGWVNDVANGVKAAITGTDYLAMALICIVLPAVLTWVFGLLLRKIGWIGENDLKLD